MKNSRLSAVALHQTEEQALVLTNINAPGLVPIAPCPGIRPVLAQTRSQMTD